MYESVGSRREKSKDYPDRWGRNIGESVPDGACIYIDSYEILESDIAKIEVL